MKAKTSKVALLKPWNKNSRATITTAVLLLIGLSALSSCGKKEAQPSVREFKKLEQHFGRGPLKVAVKVNNQEPNTADRICLSFDVTAAEDYAVQMPEFGEKLGQFSVIDVRTTQPSLVEQSQIRQSHHYVIEPFLPGEYSLPPFKFIYWERGQEKSDKQELETDEIKLQVRSVLPESEDEVQLREISAPLDLPKPSLTSLWLALGGGLGLLGLLGGGVYWLYRRSPGFTTATALTAHEWALQALEQLLAEDLVQKGEVKQFYQRISDVLRRYIEARLALHAPEQTTEEFLANLSANGILAANHKQLLKHLLRHCDQVKFAEYHPSTEDIQNTYDGCRTFIEETQTMAEAAGV